MDVNEQHFDKTYRFIIFITSFVFIYILLVTFVTIPEKNIRFVDTAFGFLLGTVLAGGVGWLLGGSPEKKKEPPMTDNSTSIQTNVDTLEIKKDDITDEIK